MQTKHFIATTRDLSLEYLHTEALSRGVHRPYHLVAQRGTCTSKLESLDSRPTKAPKVDIILALSSDKTTSLQSTYLELRLRHYYWPSKFFRDFDQDEMDLVRCSTIETLLKKRND